jgi:hypothetical protein
VHLEVARLAGGAGEAAQAAARLAAGGVGQLRVVGAEQAAQAAQRDAEVVQRLRVVGRVEARAGGPELAEQPQRDEAGGAGGRVAERRSYRTVSIFQNAMPPACCPTSTDATRASARRS